MAQHLTVAGLPEAGRKVSVCEAFLRDGIQGWPDFVATAGKTRLLAEIAAAGVPEIDATSFVSRRLVPQFADGEDVLSAVAGDLRVRVLAVNADGARRAVEARAAGRRIDRCGIPFSVSEAHNIANIRRTHAEHRQELLRMFDILRAGGIAPLLGVVTAFGCPIRGRVHPDEAMGIAEWGVGQGIGIIMFGDTTGMANPAAAAAMFGRARAAWPAVELVAHFHDNRGSGIANSLAAVAAGATTVDACLGGVGGEPKAVEQNVVGDQGNVATEDLVAVLDEMGVATGIDVARLVAAGALAEEILGRRLGSKVQRSGLAAAVGRKKEAA